MRRIRCIIAAWKMEGTMWWGMRVASWSWERPEAEPAQKSGSQSYNHKEQSLANNENACGSRNSRRRLGPASTLISSLWFPEQRTQTRCTTILTSKAVRCQVDAVLSPLMFGNLLHSERKRVSRVSLKAFWPVCIVITETTKSWLCTKNAISLNASVQTETSYHAGLSNRK